MLPKNVYLALVVEENGKFYAYARKVPGNNDLFSELQRVNGLHSANVCRSLKAAKELVQFWNACYNANGSFMFAECF